MITDNHCTRAKSIVNLDFQKLRSTTVTAHRICIILNILILKLYIYYINYKAVHLLY